MIQVPTETKRRLEAEIRKTTYSVTGKTETYMHSIELINVYPQFIFYIENTSTCYEQTKFNLLSLQSEIYLKISMTNENVGIFLKLTFPQNYPVNPPYLVISKPKNYEYAEVPYLNQFQVMPPILKSWNQINSNSKVLIQIVLEIHNLLNMNPPFKPSFLPGQLKPSTKVIGPSVSIPFEFESEQMIKLKLIENLKKPYLEYFASLKLLCEEVKIAEINLRNENSKDLIILSQSNEMRTFLDNESKHLSEEISNPIKEKKQLTIENIIDEAGPESHEENLMLNYFTKLRALEECAYELKNAYEKKFINDRSELMEVTKKIYRKEFTTKYKILKIKEEMKKNKSTK